MSARPIALALALALLGCDATSEEPAVDTLSGREPPPLPAEVALTAGDFDDVFPDLDGDDLVWCRATATAEDVDCMECPYCAECSWEIRHRDLASGDERVIWTGRMLSSAPRVGEGRISWMDDSSTHMVFDLASGERESTTLRYTQSPAPSAGLMWAAAYWQSLGTNVIVGWDFEASREAVLLASSASAPWSYVQATLADRGRRVPLAIGHERLAWIAYEQGWVVRTVALTDPTMDESTTVVVDSARTPLSVTLVGDELVVMSYVTDDGCTDQRCAVALHRVARDGAAVPFAPEARPTRYQPMSVADDRLVWLDHRDGPYTVWGMDLDGNAQQLSSAEARLGINSPVAASGRRVVWSDRRSGRWHLVTRVFPSR